MELYEWEDLVLNLECGWTNQWCFIDNRDRLLAYKKEALANKKQLAKEGYDVQDVYKQLDEFDACTKRQKPLTDDEEESIILAAFEYSENNRPIISTKRNNLLNQLDTCNEKEKWAFRYKFDVRHNLISFYISYADKIEIFDTVIVFIQFSEFLIKKYPNDEVSYNCTGTIIYYLKFLVKNKQFDRALFILENFNLKPRGKTETAALEKIKAKIEQKK